MKIIYRVCFIAVSKGLVSGRNVRSKKLSEVMVVAGKGVLCGRICTDKYTQLKV